MPRHYVASGTCCRNRACPIHPRRQGRLHHKPDLRQPGLRAGQAEGLPTAIFSEFLKRRIPASEV
jgi:hypothetical protein